MLITFVSPENAGSSPRNSARSQVAMATGGNRLKLGRVLALPGWSCLAGHTLKGRDLSTCWVLIRGRSSPSCEGEAGPHTAPSTLCPPVPPTGRWAAALPAEHAAAALIVSRSVTSGLSPPAQLLLVCSLCVSVDEPEPGGQQWPWPWPLVAPHGAVSSGQCCQLKGRDRQDMLHVRCCRDIHRESLQNPGSNHNLETSTANNSHTGQKWKGHFMPWELLSHQVSRGAVPGDMGCSGMWCPCCPLV